MKKFAALLLALLFLPAAVFSETVVTSFYPVFLITINLAEGFDNLSVRNLAAPSVGCLHDYQLQPADLKSLEGADALIINGAGMEAFLPEIVHAFPALPVIEAAEGIDLLLEENAVQIGDAEEEANSHIWLDPARMIRMAENIAAGLAKVFPENKDVFFTNLDVYRKRLKALDTRLRDGLKDLPRKDIVTFHEAFPYFAEAYGLHIVAVVNREPGEILTAAQMGRLALEIKKLGNPPLFVEPQYTDLSAQTLSRETGSPVFTLDPVVTGPVDHVPPDYYEQIMLQNMNELIKALSGSLEDQ